VYYIENIEKTTIISQFCDIFLLMVNIYKKGSINIMPRKKTELDIDLLEKLNDAIKYSGVKPTEISKKVGIKETTMSDYKHLDLK